MTIVSIDEALAKIEDILTHLIEFCETTKEHLEEIVELQESHGLRLRKLEKFLDLEME
jgi:hypothetical protein